MSLSDYDCVGFDANAKSVSPVLTYKTWRFELYKTWLYIANSWHEGEKDKGFTGDIIGKITNGRFALGPVSGKLHEIQDTQHHGFGVFMLLSYFDPENKDGKEHYFGGIACNGYKRSDFAVIEELHGLGYTGFDTTDDLMFMSSSSTIIKCGLAWNKDIDWEAYIKIGDGWHYIKRERNWLRKLPKKIYNHITTHISNSIFITKSAKKMIVIEPGETYNQDDYVGITNEMFKDYIEWVKTDCDWVYSDAAKKDWIKKLSSRSIVKCNQGDE